MFSPNSTVVAVAVVVAEGAHEGGVCGSRSAFVIVGVINFNFVALFGEKKELIRLILTIFC